METLELELRFATEHLKLIRLFEEQIENCHTDFEAYKPSHSRYNEAKMMYETAIQVYEEAMYEINKAFPGLFRFQLNDKGEAELITPDNMKAPKKMEDGLTFTNLPA